jgi:hypothetical protein
MTLLAGTFAKLDRADHHVANLYSEVQVWGGREPYSLIEEDNPEKTERIYRVKIDHPPDVLGWGVQVGDAIHNLRSALDTLAWQAAGGDGVAPDWTEFPIFKDQSRYLNTGRGGGLYKISGVADPNHRALFEKCQPWRNPDGHDKDALWMLHEFDRIDKHRVVTPVFTVALKATGQVLVTYENEEAAQQADAAPPILKSPPQAPVEDGAEVLRILTPSPFVEMQMNSRVDLGVSLQYGDRPYRGGVHFLLTKMAQRARGIAEQFRDIGL